MTIVVEFKDGEKAKYENINNLVIGINDRDSIDRLEMNCSMSNREKINIVFADDALTSISKIYKDGEEIYN